MRKRAALAAAALALLAAACREPMPPADGTYQTRGVVIRVPAAADGELVVQHEEVPAFRDRDGKPSHMDSMSMPFAVAPQVSLSGLTPGDKVAMTFEVRWSGEPALRITELRGLPDDVPLELGGPKLELVAPLGSGRARPTPAATPSPTPGARPATDGPSAPPSETI